jgi:predicted DsbA family dithiol-disulfide isomerase
VCLDKVREELRGEVNLDLVWKSYLLRPHAEPKPLEKFRRYTESWMRPAAQEGAPEFRVWATSENPPSHSIPSSVAVKAAARQNAFDRYHVALMQAYFARNLDVSARETIVLVARECGLDVELFERDLDDPALVEAVVAEHNEAIELGVTAVPCVVLDGGFVLPGSQERAVYISIVRRLISRQASSQGNP